MDIRLQRMKGQRRQHSSGDVLVAQLGDADYLFGRIVTLGSETAANLPPGDMLVYLYDIRSTTPEPEVEALTIDHLLMPPFFTIRWMWHKGYFRTVTSAPIQPGDLLEQHCFYSPAREKYVDENDRVLDRRYSSCGMFALPNLNFLEYMIDSALDGEPWGGPHRSGESPVKD